MQLVPYFSEFLPKPKADALFEHCLTLQWLNATEARQEYFMSTQPRKYTYGTGLGQRTYTSAPFTAEVSQLLEALNAPGGIRGNYDVCFLNRYNNQKQQLGWHADDGAEMDPKHSIAVISLGAEREIWWRKHLGDKQYGEIHKKLLAHGSLFEMPPGFQQDHQHRIPKSSREVGTRISLTFRRWLDVEPTIPPIITE